MIKLPMQFEDAYSLQSFLAHYSESVAFRRWVGPVLDWAERNAIEMHPVCRDGDWGFKIVLFDSNGKFFDFIEPLRIKKREGDEVYAARVWTALSAECASIRLMRIQNTVGRSPMARAA